MDIRYRPEVGKSTARIVQRKEKAVIKKSISCTGANAWTSYFSKFYSEGKTVAESAQLAAEHTANDHPLLHVSNQLNIDSYCIVH